MASFLNNGEVRYQIGHQVVHGNVNHIFTTGPSSDDIDQLCLRTLRCPDSLAVKNRLKENKDKVLFKSIAWIFRDPQYVAWQSDNDIGLLWIKGGAGKGKTMMSIGLIERLSEGNRSVIVTYAFCQKSDSELNTVASIIKGLILRLVHQDETLKQSLSRRWNREEKKFDCDVSAWRTLWDIFLEMVNDCRCERLYIVIDALDECEGAGMATLLRLVVRTGLQLSSKIKWLLTSRPLEIAERELMAGSEQLRVDLELNSDHISDAVRIYVVHQLRELDRRHNYGSDLCWYLEDRLVEKAQDTFLWVSLVCKSLENVPRDEARALIQNQPLGLHSLYHEKLQAIKRERPEFARWCLRLLMLMHLSYGPLTKKEVHSLLGASPEIIDLRQMVSCCGLFIRLRGSYIEFVHQSAGEYLAQQEAQKTLETVGQYGDGDITANCLKILSRQLKPNIFSLSSPESGPLMRDPRLWQEIHDIEDTIDYAARFWVEHFVSALKSPTTTDMLPLQVMVSQFMREKLLEWLEYLSASNNLYEAIDALAILCEAINKERQPFLSEFVLDAVRFLSLHFQTIRNMPLQIYSSAIVFSPSDSVIRRQNLSKAPVWLKRLPEPEDGWSSVVKTLLGHTDSVYTVATSPDGRFIFSGSKDKTIRMFDSKTAGVMRTFVSHTACVWSVAVSPDGKHIVSGSEDKTVKLWFTATGLLADTFTDHSDWVRSVAFSPTSTIVASGSDDRLIKLWNFATGRTQTLSGHDDYVFAVAFSPNGNHIVSGSKDGIIKVWSARSGQLRRSFTGHSESVNGLAFSSDSDTVASASADETVRLWKSSTGQLLKTLNGHTDWVRSVAFSPDGQILASGSDDRTIKLWNVATGTFRASFRGHANYIRGVTFTPDGKIVVSGSHDQSIILWDANGSDKEPLRGHSAPAIATVFSACGNYTASCSPDKTVKLWNAAGGTPKTLQGHTDDVFRVVFSPNNKLLVSASNDKTVKLWTVPTGQLYKTFTGHTDAVYCVAVCPFSKRIASGSSDQTVILWNIKGGHQRLKGHSDSVWSVSFSSDGRYVVSGSTDKSVRLWDAANGAQLRALVDQPDRVRHVAFSPDGKMIAANFVNALISIWKTADLLPSTSLTRSALYSALSSRMSSRKPDEAIQLRDATQFLRFSSDSRYLETSLGSFKIHQHLTVRRVYAANGLCYNSRWICFGSVPLLYLPTNSVVINGMDIRGKDLVIGFGTGQVLHMEFDSEILNILADEVNKTV